jgi:hypothetical protein
VVGVCVEVTVVVFVTVGVGVNPVVGVTVGVGLGITYTKLPTSQFSESTIFTIKLLSASGEGTVNEYGKVETLETNWQFALIASQ